MTTVEPRPVRTRVIGLSDASLAYDLLVLRANVSEVLLTKSEDVIVDVSELTRPSSTALAALLWAKRSCASGGVRFAMDGVGPRNRVVLRRSGLVLQRPRERP